MSDPKNLIPVFFLSALGLSAIIIFFVLPPQKTAKNNSLNNTSLMTDKKTIRQPAFAGQFYPDRPEELNTMIDRLLSARNNEFSGQPRILIVPHAGYIFSGSTAASAYQTISGQSWESVIIIGSSHHYPLPGLTLYAGDAVATPLGEQITDQKTINTLITADNNIFTDNKVHFNEHSLEVQIPFLQKTLRPGWRIILGLINNDDHQILASIADTLSRALSQKNILLVVSSDLSHYPSHNDARRSDLAIMNAILTKDINAFEQTFSSLINENLVGLDTCACAAPALKIAMLIAHNLNLAGAQLHYANSGDIPDYGDRSRVVGYGALVFFEEKTKKNNDQYFLNATAQQTALKLARATLKNAFSLMTNKEENYKNHPLFSQKMGIFVTLKKNDQLRGCIGLIEPLKTLAEGIMEMTLAAAFEDPRFIPLDSEELNDLKIEISVLTPPQKISNPQKEIELGRHGVIVKKNSLSGVFLPQVATETGWDLNTFMSHLCADKAGLPADCWLDGSTDIYIFEAQVFEEK